MRAREERAFREFIEVRMAGLRRSAYLLCGDIHAADDLVSVTLAKLLRHWRRVAGLEYPDSYLRRMLVTAYLDERRRPWRREQVTDRLPEPPPVASNDVVDRVTLLGLLDRLPPRRRAVLVLRFFDDLSVEQTAEVLGCAAGTVKSLTHQGLSDLRALLGQPANALSNLDLTTKEEP
jgi:RNA polymerase sigma-70 factor (sigma-E family)